jgi:aminopeptidase N
MKYLSRARGSIALPLIVLLLATWAGIAYLSLAAQRKPLAFDVLHYEAEIEPSIASKSVKGTVKIRLKLESGGSAEISLDCGGLTIDSVTEGKAPLNISRRDKRLMIALPTSAGAGLTREIVVRYQGNPAYGIRFYPEEQQVYTVFSTSQWMVCVDAPEDKATFDLSLILPADQLALGNGRLSSHQLLRDGRAVHRWKQEIPVATYIFGFAAGRFRELKERHGRVTFRYLTAGFSDEEMRRIFAETPAMLRFFEDHGGIRYVDESYTQVLAAGRPAQEMSGFTVMGDSHGREVLADHRSIGLAAHEFAHQWWGNMVTCVDWTDFWLNEGIANFMEAAFIESRFGRQAYMNAILESRDRYEKVRDAGKDRSLVFPDWNSPTREDRTLVYDKGSYVLHLLREEIGESSFWKGIRAYTRAYVGKSVVTRDFQKEMEKACGKSLDTFCNKWVYMK